MRVPYPLRAPWAITEGGLELVLAVWSRGEAYADRIEKALLARDGEPLKNARTVANREGVAIIPINGPLIRHASMFDDISGATSYEQIRKDFQAALDSEDIKAIVFDVDSPGGEVAGCAELSKAIFEARGKKPIVTYASGMLCSAAYWLGSASDRIVVESTAIVGSIGVRTALIDDSKRDEAQGIKEYQIVSDQSPLKIVDPSKEEDRARVKENLTSMAAVFVANVARNRAVTDATVLRQFGRGDVFVGAEAVGANLADSVGDLESLIASLKAENENIERTSYMSAAQKSPSASLGDEKCDGCGRDMDDDDATYCRACHSEADASAAFMGEMLALTGKASAGDARATLAAWKQSSEEIAELRQKFAALEKSAAEAAYEAAVKEFRDAGVIPPSADHKRSKYVAGLKGQPNAAAQVRAYCESLDALVPVAEAKTPPTQIEKPAELAAFGELPPVGALTDDDKRMLAAAGYKPEQIISMADERAKRAAK